MIKIKKRKCKECRNPFTPSGTVVVCSFDCAVAYGKKTAAKAAAKRDKEQAKRHKEQRAKERKQKADFRKTDTKWLKAKAQEYCNRYIRIRDELCGCISCGTRADIKYDAGHFIPAGRCIPLRYNELNIHKQCTRCNTYMGGNPTPYEAALRIKLGNEIVEWLKGQHEPIRYRAEDYLRIIDDYKAKIKLLQTGKMYADSTRKQKTIPKKLEANS